MQLRKDWPSMGSVVEYLAQHEQNRKLPSYAVVPNWLGKLQDAGQYRRPGEYAGWLGQTYNPMTTVVNKRNRKDNPYWRDCADEELTFQIDGMSSPKEVTLDRLDRRLSLLKQFDEQRQTLESSKSLTTHDRFRERALALVTSAKVRQALNIRQEPTRLRDAYGRHLFGQASLMARSIGRVGSAICDRALRLRRWIQLGLASQQQ